MLNIKKRNDPSGLLTVDKDGLRYGTLCVCIYGHSGVGTTSLAISADAPLLLDFDMGAITAISRVDMAQIGSWKEIEGIIPTDLSPYKTIIIDTIGTALEMLDEVIAKDTQLGREAHEHALLINFSQWLNSLHEQGKDVILVAALDEHWFDETGRKRIYVPDGLHGGLCSYTDLIGLISFEGDKRLIDFNPTETSVGKNPTNLSVLEVPNGRSEFLAGIIRSVGQELANRELKLN